MENFVYDNDESILDRLLDNIELYSKVLTKEEFEKLEYNKGYLEYQNNKDEEKIRREREINLKIFEEKQKEKSKIN